MIGVLVHKAVVVEPEEGQGFARKASLGLNKAMISVPHLAIPRLSSRGKPATPIYALKTVSGTTGEIGGPALKHAARAPPQGQKQGKGKSRPSQRELGKNARQFRRTLIHVVSGLSVLLTVIGLAGKRRVFAGMSG